MLECRTTTNQTPLDLAITSQMKELLLSFKEKPSSQSCSQGKKKRKLGKNVLRVKQKIWGNGNCSSGRNQKLGENVLRVKQKIREKTVLKIKQEIR